MHSTDAEEQLPIVNESNSSTILQQNTHFMLNGYGIGRTNFAINELLGLASATTIPPITIPANSAVVNGTFANYFMPQSTYCHSSMGNTFIDQSSSNLLSGLEFVPMMQLQQQDFSENSFVTGGNEINSSMYYMHLNWDFFLDRW